MLNKVFMLVLALAISQSLCSSDNHNNSEEDVSRTLRSLEHVIDFYVRSIDKVNLDSIFGLRVAEGGITKILNEFDKVDDTATGRRFTTRLTSLLKTVKETATEALPHLNDYQPEYYQNFKPIVEKPWTSFKDFRKLNSWNLNRKSTLDDNGSRHGETFNEKISDRCMTEIMGTAAGQKNPCYVSVDCLKLMTSRKLKRYGNTHQVLYFLLGFESGCRHILERKIKKLPHWGAGESATNVDEFLEKKCAQILDEMNVVQRNVVSNGETDLFLEQGLVCGILGFKDFLNHGTLRNMIKWQDSEHGCFGTETNEYYHKIQNDDEGQQLHPIHDYDEKRFSSRRSMRKLLYDRALSNGCSSHETGVATGLLSIYLRWSLFNDHELN